MQAIGLTHLLGWSPPLPTASGLYPQPILQLVRYNAINNHRIHSRDTSRRRNYCQALLPHALHHFCNSSGRRQRFLLTPPCHSSLAGQGANSETTTLPETRKLDAEIFNIAFPTLATLAADPLAALVSTAWVGQMGAVELAGVGVALSVYGAFTKLFNMPLLAVITSSIAAALGKGHDEESPQVASAVVSALVLALGVGVIQAILLYFMGLSGLTAWGAGPGTLVHSSAVDYLTVRALSAPATVFFLALQGTFRGLGDTRAPLAATVISNVLNIVLEPLFIFHFNWGVRGAAGAIAVAQVASCAVLAGLLTRRLNFKSSMTTSGKGALQGAWEFIKPTGLLTLRTLSITATFAVATGLAARTDATHAAAHQIAFQLWLASSLLADSLAVAAQSLVARAFASRTLYGRTIASQVANRVTRLSLGLGVALAVGLTVGMFLLPLPRLFSSDPAVLRTLSLLLPAVIATQPINAAAFTLDGILYGVKGFSYAAGAMVVAAVPSIGAMLLGVRVAAHAGLGADGQLYAVWAGLALVMTLRFATIYAPLIARKDPFDQLIC